MAVVLLRLPEDEDQIDSRPKKCPYCESTILQAWGTVSRFVQDLNERETLVRRYRCIDCDRTFRDLPDGIDRSRQSQRVRRLAALAVAMGMTIRDVAKVFEDLGLPISRSTVWRESRSFIEMVSKDEEGKRCLQFDVDRIFPLGIKRVGVKLLVAFGQKKYALLGTLDEHNPRKVIRCLRPYLEDLEIEASTLETDLMYQYSNQYEVLFPPPV